MILLHILLFLSHSLVQSQSPQSQQPQSQQQPQLQITVYEGPTDCEAAHRIAVGSRVGLHYVGSIDASSAAGVPGTQFDASRRPTTASTTTEQTDNNNNSNDDTPLDVTVGVGDLIDGWDQGLLGLCQQAKAILVLPPAWAYGDVAVGDVIPAGATLRFDVEIVTVAPYDPNQSGFAHDLFPVLDVNSNDLLSFDEVAAFFGVSVDNNKHDNNDAIDIPNIIAQDDADGDGQISRAEFGGPKLPWDQCVEMLHQYARYDPEAATQNQVSDTLRLSVEWICRRPQHGADENDNDDDDDDGQKTTKKGPEEVTTTPEPSTTQGNQRDEL